MRLTNTGSWYELAGKGGTGSVELWSSLNLKDFCRFELILNLSLRRHQIQRAQEACISAVVVPGPVSGFSGRLWFASVALSLFSIS